MMTQINLLCMENKLTDVVIRRKLHEDSNTLPIKIILLIGDKTEFLKNRKKKTAKSQLTWSTLIKQWAVGYFLCCQVKGDGHTFAVTKGNALNILVG